MKSPTILNVTLDKIAGGGQAIGTLGDGRKAFVWGGLPGENVNFQVTKKKSHFVEGKVTEALKKSANRVTPKDEASYLSTSPWQIIDFSVEQQYKTQLIYDAFRLSDVELPLNIELFTDNKQYFYRNKMEYSWYSDTTPSGDTLDLAFFTRGGRGKYPVEGSSLANPAITKLSIAVRDLLRAKGISARNLKTLLIRCNQNGEAVWQLYIKDKINGLINESEAMLLPALGGEVIYSNPKSPASVITEKLQSFGSTNLNDTILGIKFNYAVDGFFQVNIPVYQQALHDMKHWIDDKPLLDLYSGVGSIGLSIGSNSTILIEINENAVNEMRNNAKNLNKNAEIILAPAEKVLDYITADKTIILDPPRAGVHSDVLYKIIEVKPTKILYLSCNPITQARDIAKLLPFYNIAHIKGYNFFPRTPHIENLVVLNLIK